MIRNFIAWMNQDLTASLPISRDLYGKQVSGSLLTGSCYITALDLNERSLFTEKNVKGLRLYTNLEIDGNYTITVSGSQYSLSNQTVLQATTYYDEKGSFQVTEIIV
jgi:hypothetical protein